MITIILLIRIIGIYKSIIGALAIGDSAFGMCKFSSVTIPATVTSIGADAFGWNSNLTDVTIEGTNSWRKFSSDGSSVVETGVALTAEILRVNNGPKYTR